jgi:sec-independent protein translocase protein TatA
MGPVGWTEMVVIFFVALVVFGPEKLPELAKTAAKGLREFKKATDGLKANWEDHLRDTENPINDLKKTFDEARSEISETSAKLIEDEPAAVTTVTKEDEPATKVDDSPAHSPEEKKPDGN